MKQKILAMAFALASLMATAVEIFPLQPGNGSFPDPLDLGLCKTLEEF